jgi:protein gp37
LIEKIDWIIVGGESGPKARPMLEDWVLKIKANCEEHSVPFFFKQWGGVNKKKTGRLLLNQTWDALPLTAKTSL